MFCVMNIQKRKKTDIGGIQKEATRTAAEYNNRVMPGMDIFNVNLIQSNNWLQDIQQEIDKAGAHTRSNSVVALDTIYTASPDFFKGRNNAENDMFFEDCLKFHQKRFGHIISAVIHYDETTPHLHVLSVPLTQDGRLSAREIVGNRAKMSQMQTAFYEQVGRDYGLERGIHMDGQEKKKHITAQERRLQQIKEEKAKELDELGAIKHSKDHARERAQKARERAADAERRRQFSERAAESAKNTARSYEEHAEQVARQINDKYGELADAGLQKQEMQKQVEQLQERIDNLQEQLEYARADYKKAYNRCRRAERRATDLQNILTAAERRQVEQIRQEQEREQKQFEEDEWEIE